MTEAAIAASQAPAPAGLPTSVAAVDLGSNSFHMIVARPEAGKITVLDRLRETVGLASGLDEKRRLTPEARTRAIECLQRFGQRVAHLPPGSVRAVGTNTLRRAHGAGDFLREAGEALGHPIQTISGIEEARLIYLGVSQSHGDPAGQRLVVDIGGGSTEVIVGDRRPRILDSLYLGCVSVSDTFFGGGKIDKARWKKARTAVLQEFEPVQGRYAGAKPDEIIGASGTVRAVASVLRGEKWAEHGITRKLLRRLRDAMLEAGDVSKFAFAGLDADRAAVFPGGVAILLGAFEALDIRSMDVSNGALREGLLVDLLGRFGGDDVREGTVKSLATRYHTDRRHGERIGKTAVALLRGVGTAWKLDDAEAAHLLEWAARLHEIGLDVAHSHYHRHGQYILAHSDLPGFSREEQNWLATLVRAHRRKFPEPEFVSLPDEARHRIERLAMLLRLAVLLHRSRRPDPVTLPECSVDGEALCLRFPAGWANSHPLTLADLQGEAESIAAAGHTLRLEAD
jgi:exopolyphosphatase / guanosine-5'-triphosphate,3'-diphosphate pyrophosphatase